jgi:hypothetical protein
MKKIVLILALFPLVGLADTEEANPNTPSIFRNECNNTKDPVERKKNCLAMEKQKEAEEAFRNFQENNHIETTL